MLNKIKFLTAGESHGKALMGILDGIPSNLPISEEYIRKQLSRRQMGFGRGGRMKIESDYAEIVSGVRYGKTLGSPIGLIIDNKDWRNWKEIMETEASSSPVKKITLPRPGHADLAGLIKYDFNDIRCVIERSSARETAMRVAIGSICRKFIEELGIEVASRVVQIHDVIDRNKLPEISKINDLADKSPTRCVSKSDTEKMVERIKEARKSGDSVGGVFEIIIYNLPYGLGSYTQWDKKMQSKLAETIMSINAIKGVEFGEGFKESKKFGSDVHDEIGWDGSFYTRNTNRAGGLEGGMTNAQPLIIRAAMKPLSSLSRPLKSVDINNKKSELAHKERSDTCAVPAASIIAENIACIVIADSILEKFGGDSIQQVITHYEKTSKY